MFASNIPQLRGVNMAGANFPYTSLPPASGSNYQFPSTQDIDYIVAKGGNFFRLLVSWEALQDSLNATLGSGGAAYSTYLAQMEAFVAYATGKGVTVMIEPHGAIDADFAAWKGNAVGTSSVPNSAFANFWGQMAALFAANSLVAFGLSNEPCAASEGGPTGGGGVAAWFASCNTAIAAIRSNGFKGLILVPGQQFTNVSQWLSNWYDTGSPQISNMTGVAAITDSEDNWCISVHLYLNQDQGGDTTDVGASTTIASGSNGLTLPQSTIHVASTSEWTSDFGLSGPGLIAVTTASGVETVAFTGLTSTSFTGCSGGAGKMSTGGAVNNAAFVATELLQPLITACRAAGIRLHLSEFGVQASTTNAAAAAADLLQLLNANQDVCIGMAWWVDGPQSWYDTANYTLCPTQGNGSDVYSTDSPQLPLAAAFWQGTAQNPAQAANAAVSAAAAAAQATATAASSAAVAAQSTANTAVTNAAAAQSTATAAGSAAAAAQTTASGAASAVTALAATVATLTPGSGPTASRPSGVLDGTSYVDTTLGIPITAFAASMTGWINSSGTPV